MKDGQDAVYYLTGATRTAVENSPHMEAFTAKGYEVLILTDPVDEVWVDQVTEFDGHRLQSIAKGQVDLDTDDGDDADDEKTKHEADFAALLPWLTSTLSDHVKQARLSSRLTTSAACVVGDDHDVTPQLEKMYRAMNQQIQPVKRILEINPKHPLITALRTAHEKNPDNTTLPDLAEIILGTALLAEGGDLPDPARFARQITDHLTHTL